MSSTVYMRERVADAVGLVHALQEKSLCFIQSLKFLLSSLYLARMPSHGHAIALTFLNSSNFEDSKSKKHRTKVRSHISKLQHARSRDLEYQRQQSCANLEQLSGVVDDEEGNDATLPKSLISEHSSASQANYATDIPQWSTQNAIASTFPVKRNNDHDRALPLDVKQRKVTDHHFSQDADESRSVWELQMRQRQQAECQDATVTPSTADIALTGRGSFAPVHYKPWYGWLMDYWYGKTLPESRKLLKATSEDIKEYTIFSNRQEHAEPALYYMALLLASGIP